MLSACSAATFISYHNCPCLSTTFLTFFLSCVPALWLSPQRKRYLTRWFDKCQQLFSFFVKTFDQLFAAFCWPRFAETALPGLFRWACFAGPASSSVCLFPTLHPTVQCKPEPDSAIYIFNTAGFVVGIHNGFHNGQADSAPSIFPGPGLVYFVELGPKIV